MVGGVGVGVSRAAGGFSLSSFMNSASSSTLLSF
jgi:hypothetical protein